MILSTCVFVYKNKILNISFFLFHSICYSTDTNKLPVYGYLIESNGNIIVNIFLRFKIGQDDDVLVTSLFSYLFYRFDFKQQKKNVSKIFRLMEKWKSEKNINVIEIILATRGQHSQHFRYQYAYLLIFFLMEKKILR